MTPEQEDTWRLCMTSVKNAVVVVDAAKNANDRLIG